MHLLKRVWLVLFIVIAQYASGWAGIWSEQDLSVYVGNWQGNAFPSKFPFAQGVQLSFWLNAREDLEGAILFSKGQNCCVGHVQIDSLQEQLEFSAKEGALCPELANSTFSLFRPMRGGVFGLRFHTPSSTPASNLYNVTHFHKIREPNTKLHAYTAILKESSHDIENIKNTQTQHYKNAVADIELATQQPYRLDFQDSKMIGVWEGEFVGGQKAFPAKMVYWSGVPFRHQIIVGVTLFDNVPLSEPLCPAGVYKGDRLGGTVSISYINLKDLQQRCKRVSTAGKTYWNAKDDTLMFVLDEPLVGTPAGRGKLCLNRPTGELGLSEETCMIGVFHRTRADDGLRHAIADVQWGRIKSPSPEDMNILFDQPDQIGKLAAAHEKAASKNALIDQQIQAEREEFKSRKEAERAARIAKAEKKKTARRERIARNKTRFAMRRGGGFTDSSGPSRIPDVSGPFDALPGKDLLNAIYAQDWNSVKSINQFYSSEKLRQHKKIMGGRHWSDGFIEAGFKAIDLSKNVLAVYLFNYQKQYGACLEPDAVPFTVVDYAPDISIKNVLGQEIARSYGYEIHQKFKVNKEFAPAFRKVGRMKPEGGMMIADFFLNQGGTDIRQEAIRGIKTMMHEYDCHSPEIKKMEKALLQVGLR